VRPGRSQKKKKSKDGRCQTEDGTLAGSALDMATAVRNCVQHIGIPKDEALRMGSTYLAEFLGVDGRLGHIAPDYEASLVILDNEIDVQGTFVRGSASWNMLQSPEVSGGRH
jgi:N-acetylglucosamine-6-phosphate deacetylase